MNIRILVIVTIISIFSICSLVLVMDQFLTGGSTGTTILNKLAISNTIIVSDDEAKDIELQINNEVKMILQERRDLWNSYVSTEPTRLPEHGLCKINPPCAPPFVENRMVSMRTDDEGGATL